MKKIHQCKITDNFRLGKHNLIEDASSLINDARDSGKKTALHVELDATHSGRLTNLRVYPGVKMKKGVSSWLQPRPKPVLKNHDIYIDPVGRVVTADFIAIKHGKDFQKDYLNPTEDQGSGYIKLGVHVMDMDTIEKIVDGRLLNVSTHQISDGLKCSICGEDFYEDTECNHRPGVHYTFKESKEKYLCYAITGDLTYREVSFVSIPGDAFAEVTSFSMDNLKDGLEFYDSSVANVVSMSISSDNEEIDLLTSKSKQAATADDRAKLTGKVIIAVSPLFEDELVQSNEEYIMTKPKNETKSDAAASGDSLDPAQELKNDQSKEGVVAPEGGQDAAKAGSVVTNEAFVIAIDSVSKSLKVAEAKTQEVSAENERLKSTITTKDSEVKELRDANALLNGELKAAYAKNLITIQMIMKKPTVANIDSAEAYDVKLKEYTERSLDSLKDSLKDLSIEFAQVQDKFGLKTSKDLVSEPKVTSPVANTGDTKDEGESINNKDKVLSAFLSN